MGWDGMAWDGMGWDEMGWDGMGWDGMEWNGMRWDAMGWDGMRWDGCGVFYLVRGGSRWSHEEDGWVRWWQLWEEIDNDIGDIANC